MLQWTRIQLPLSGPLDQATHPKIVDPTQRVASLVNATYNHDGAISKAHGYDGITYTTPQYSAGVRVGRADVHSMVSDGQRIYIGALHRVDPAAGSDYYAPDFYQAMSLGSNNVVSGVGAWSPVVVSQFETVKLAYLGGGYINVCSVVAAGGYLWTVWNDNGTVYYQVSDETTGVVLKAKTAVWKPGANNVNDLRVVALTDYVFIFNDYFNAGYLIATVLDASDPTAAASSAQVTNTKDPDIGWDACYFNDGSNESAILVWYYGISDRLYLAQYTNAAAYDAIDFDDTITAWDGPLACCYHHDTANNDHLIAVAYQHDKTGAAGGIRVRTFDDGLGLDAASGDLMTVGTIDGTVTRLAISTEIAGAGALVGYSAVTVWVEALRDDSEAAVKAELDLAELCDNCDTIIEAHTGGYEGNEIEVALIGDSGLGAGVTISRAGRSFTIHFEDGVSVRADVETAIAALAGADDLIDVKTAGTEVGLMTVDDDQASSTMLHSGIDATDLEVSRVRPVKCYRTDGPPTLTVYGVGSAWENCQITSRAVYFKQRSHCWLHYVSDEWPLMALVTTGDYVSSLWQRTTEAIANQGRSVFRHYFSMASAWDDGQNIWAGTTITNDDETKSIVAVKADFSPAGLRCARVGGASLVGGGQLYALDGRCSPHGFAHFPEMLQHMTWTGSHAGGGLMEGGTYKYLTLYEWTDLRGLVHRGTPSLPREIVIPFQAQLSGMATVINDDNKYIDYQVVTMWTGGVMERGEELTVTLTVGNYDSPAALAAQINTDLNAAGAPFRLLAGAAATIDGVDYTPHSTDHYELVLTPDAGGFVVLFKRGTHGADGTSTSAASLLGFDTTNDLFVACVAVNSGAAYQALYAEASRSFQLLDPAEQATVRLDVRNLIIGDETRNAADVRICLFRTLADGSEFYLVDTYANDPSAAWQTITDTATDASISEHRQPYTTGEPNDVLENAHPIAHILWAHGDRIWAVDNEDRRRVWVSKPVAVGVAPEFPYELQIVMPEEITAGLSITTHSVLFSKLRCWAITGDGPNALGVGDWLAPRLLSSDNGAVDYRGVCEIEGGAIVLGQRGLYAIQGGAVQPIGREVQDLLEGVEVLAIISRRDDREVWVFCQPAGADGYVVVYDYERKRWSKLTWGAAGSPSAAVEQDGLIYFGTATGSLRVEAQDWDYGGTAYAHQVETGWLKLEGLAGYQRVRRAHLIGTWIGTCTVAVEVFYDYEAAPAQTVSLPMLTAPAPDALARIVPTRQKCAAIKFRVTVTATPAAPEKRGVDLHAIELEIGTKGAFHRASVGK